ncbi:hypothetical protein U1839_25680 [Sphingomonas sp. RT2P30]|uniref:hypothetical protein n=1 Tax=Parasphingomonas halimpatiens TaxID=3096162 RepID=UPI002FCCA0C4
MMTPLQRVIQQPRQCSMDWAASHPDSHGRLFPIVGPMASAPCWNAAIPVTTIGNKSEENIEAIRIMRRHYFFTRRRAVAPHGLVLT